MSLGLQRLTRGDINNHVVTVAGKQDEIFQPQYDSATYTSGTTTQITFFSLPIGQGTTTAPGASGPKTLADTNITNAGLLPAGNRFYCTGVELQLFPGVNPGRGGVADSTAGYFVNDMYALGKSGVLTMTIQQRNYVQEGPCQLFVPSSRLAGFSGSSTNLTTGAATYSEVSYAAWAGAMYHIVPVFIVPNQYFTVSVQWPAAITMPSGQNARLFCRLRGRLIRDAQ